MKNTFRKHKIALTEEEEFDILSLENGVIPMRYWQLFKDMVINVNAMSRRYDDVDKAVEEFYLKYRNAIHNSKFTLKNLNKLADKIIYQTGNNYTPGATELDPQGWWNEQLEESKASKNMKKNVVRLNESQLSKLIQESVKRVIKEMDELSPDFLINAKKAYQDKYGETGLRNRDWSNFIDREHYQKGRGYKDIFDQKPEWDKKREENGVKSDPNDLKTYRLRKNGKKDYIGKHIRNFDSAISNAMHSPEYSGYLNKLTAGLDPLTAAAVKAYYPGDLDWGDEDMFDNFEHGYGEFGDSASVYDDEGKLWKFYRDYQGHNEGGSIEVDKLEDITFESPDGQTGSIPSEFWYPEY